MKFSLLSQFNPIKFINYDRFVTELMKVEIIQDRPPYYRYAIPKYPYFKSFLAEDSFK